MPKQKKSGILLAGIVLSAVVILYVVMNVQRNHRFQISKEDISVLPKTVQFDGETMPGEVFRGFETARKEKNKELIAEIKKIIAQKNMPSDVFKNNVPDTKNIAVTLTDSFHAYVDNPGELQILRRAAPNEAEWSFDQAALTKLHDLLERFEPKRLAVRQMLDKSDTCFYFMLHQDREVGEVIDTDASDYLEDYLLLEEYAIGQALLDGNIVEALNSLAYVFRLAQLAAEAAVPEVRYDAALIRLRALDILQTIVLDTKFNKRYLIALYELFREQLINWTPDNNVWIADRASSMKVYNRILLSGLTGALAPEEINELVQRGLVIVVEKQKKEKGKRKSDPDAEPEVIEERLFLDNNFSQSYVKDEIFYLKFMQRVIDECKKPFYKRIAVLDDIDNEILAKKEKPDEPIIACLLLRGISKLMRTCAQERAGCEIAFEAMAISLEKQAVTSLILNPFSAEPYGVERIPDEKNPNRFLIQVSSPGNRKPFRIPDYRQSEPKQ